MSGAYGAEYVMKQESYPVGAVLINCFAGVMSCVQDIPISHVLTLRMYEQDMVYILVKIHFSNLIWES